MNCEQCGTPFEPKRPGQLGPKRQRFCKTSCGVLHRIHRFRQRAYEYAGKPSMGRYEKCGFCGDYFLSVPAKGGRPQKFCKRSCKRKARLLKT